ncbi:hypothetical protein E2C01_078331 [Portunus trituberculatus]|uniref:Uncharacterized protein n=1 Tax=Portunus trituberculatus TaxID=210409 RepID=A0A5B7IPY4_PORTR|nr:hypothetical protein [Portunus trituberculatus]
MRDCFSYGCVFYTRAPKTTLTGRAREGVITSNPRHKRGYPLTLQSERGESQQQDTLHVSTTDVLRGQETSIHSRETNTGQGETVGYPSAPHGTDTHTDTHSPAQDN